MAHSLAWDAPEAAAAPVAAAAVFRHCVLTVSADASGSWVRVCACCCSPSSSGSVTWTRSSSVFSVKPSVDDAASLRPAVAVAVSVAALRRGVGVSAAPTAVLAVQRRRDSPVLLFEVCVRDRADGGADVTMLRQLPATPATSAGGGTRTVRLLWLCDGPAVWSVAGCTVRRSTVPGAGVAPETAVCELPPGAVPLASVPSGSPVKAVLSKQLPGAGKGAHWVCWTPADATACDVRWSALGNGDDRASANAGNGSDAAADGDTCVWPPPHCFGAACRPTAVDAVPWAHSTSRHCLAVATSSLWLYLFTASGVPLRRMSIVERGVSVRHCRVASRVVVLCAGAGRQSQAFAADGQEVVLPAATWAVGSGRLLLPVGNCAPWLATLPTDASAASVPTVLDGLGAALQPAVGFLEDGAAAAGVAPHVPERGAATRRNSPKRRKHPDDASGPVLAGDFMPMAAPERRRVSATVVPFPAPSASPSAHEVDAASPEVASQGAGATDVVTAMQQQADADVALLAAARTAADGKTSLVLAALRVASTFAGLPPGDTARPDHHGEVVPFLPVGVSAPPAPAAAVEHAHTHTDGVELSRPRWWMSPGGQQLVLSVVVTNATPRALRHLALGCTSSGRTMQVRSVGPSTLAAGASATVHAAVQVVDVASADDWLRVDVSVAVQQPPITLAPREPCQVSVPMAHALSAVGSVSDYAQWAHAAAVTGGCLAWLSVVVWLLLR